MMNKNYLHAATDHLSIETNNYCDYEILIAIYNNQSVCHIGKLTSASQYNRAYILITIIIYTVQINILNTVSRPPKKDPSPLWASKFVISPFSIKSSLSKRKSMYVLRT